MSMLNNVAHWQRWQQQSNTLVHRKEYPATDRSKKPQPEKDARRDATKRGGE